MSVPSRRAASLMLGIVLVVFATFGLGSPTAGQEPNRAAIVVQHGDLATASMCVTFPSEQITGFELLERSGFDFIAAKMSFGRAICWLDGEGCDYPDEDCFCHPTNFWGYWTQDSGEATPSFSDVGPDDRVVEDGDLDHWVWGPSGAAPVPQSFSDVCPAAAPSPTSEPTATPTEAPATPAASVEALGARGDDPLPRTGPGPLSLLGTAAVLLLPGVVIVGLRLRHRRG